MSATAGGTGFTAVKDTTGQSRATAYTIGSGYGTSIYRGDPVLLNTDGTLNTGAVNSDLIGVFAGCEYIDSTGKPTVSPFWPAGTVATNIVAWVYDDPTTVFSVKANGSIAATAIGDQADHVVVSGSAATGQSAFTLNSTLKGAGVQGQWRIVELDRSPDNAWGDAYTKVLVMCARHQYVAVKTAI